MFNITNQNNNSKTFSDEELQQINILIENLDYETARLLLLNRLNKNENDVAALDLLSDVLLNIGQEPEALKVLIDIFKVRS